LCSAISGANQNPFAFMSGVALISLLRFPPSLSPATSNALAAGVSLLSLLKQAS